jgi:predicted SnoaL-like aldol condensation-catalyzing enzyme
MNTEHEDKNKARVVEGFETLFNKRDFDKAERFWSPTYVQHSAALPPGRDGLFGFIRAMPPTVQYEHQVVTASGDFVMIYGRFAGAGLPKAIISVNIIRLEGEVFAEHWEVLQDEASKAESKSGLPMFGNSFPS